MERILEEVKRWPRAQQERFLERAGIHMSDGVPQAEADRRAYQQTRKDMEAELERRGMHAGVPDELREVAA